MTWLQTLNVVDPHHIEECEALFEAYFMQVACWVWPSGLAGACRLKQKAVRAHNAAARAAGSARACCAALCSTCDLAC